MADRGYAGGVEKFPEEVGGMGVGVASEAGLEAWIYADEEEVQVWGDGVAEEGSGWWGGLLLGLRLLGLSATGAGCGCFWCRWFGGQGTRGR